MVRRDAEHLERALGYVFLNKKHLKQALTHRSFGVGHNERVEFIGDGILNALVARLLYLRFPQLTEGELSRARASLVCQESLARVATELDLGQYLYLGEGELKSGGYQRPSILADALEAILGAVWLDGGFHAIEALIESLFAPYLTKIDLATVGKDAKTALQEWLQGHKQGLPVYTVVGQKDEPPHQIFDICCAMMEGALVTYAQGTSRRAAEQRAAAQALVLLKERYSVKGKK